MNKQISLNEKNKAAAQQFSDQIFSILHDAESVSFMVNEIFDSFFGEESPSTPEGQEQMAIRFERAQQQFGILIDYTVSVRDALRGLNKVASEIDRN